MAGGGGVNRYRNDVCEDDVSVAVTLIWVAGGGAGRGGSVNRYRDDMCGYDVTVAVTAVGTGEVLVLRNVTRSLGGLYECVADNGVPPAALLVVRVHVQCEWSSCLSTLN